MVAMRTQMVLWYHCLCCRNLKMATRLRIAVPNDAWGSFKKTRCKVGTNTDPDLTIHRCQLLVTAQLLGVEVCRVAFCKLSKIGNGKLTKIYKGVVEGRTAPPQDLRQLWCWSVTCLLSTYGKSIYVYGIGGAGPHPNCLLGYHEWHYRVAINLRRSMYMCGRTCLFLIVFWAWHRRVAINLWPSKYIMHICVVLAGADPNLYRFVCDCVLGILQ